MCVSWKFVYVCVMCVSYNQYQKGLIPPTGGLPPPLSLIIPGGPSGLPDRCCLFPIVLKR